jgi:hypothetical protein
MHKNILAALIIILSVVLVMYFKSDGYFWFLATLIILRNL